MAQLAHKKIRLVFMHARDRLETLISVINSLQITREYCATPSTIP